VVLRVHNHGPQRNQRKPFWSIPNHSSQKTRFQWFTTVLKRIQRTGPYVYLTTIVQGIKKERGEIEIEMTPIYDHRFFDRSVKYPPKTATFRLLPPSPQNVPFEKALRNTNYELRDTAVRITNYEVGNMKYEIRNSELRTPKYMHKFELPTPKEEIRNTYSKLGARNAKYEIWSTIPKLRTSKDEILNTYSKHGAKNTRYVLQIRS
jgi:hypothetical protein